MQTFMPYANFLLSARCLDNKRLGKQRSECKIIYKSLTNQYESGAWRNHPATKIWENHIPALLMYSIKICKEYRDRGFEDSLLDYFREELKKQNTSKITFPVVYGRSDFHKSHQSNLLRKDKEYYSKFKWNVVDTLPYVWN